MFFNPISADGRRGLFPLWDSCQSFSFYLLLPLSGDSLGQLYVPIPHSLPIRSQSANICWFPFWPGFVTSGLTYITIPLLTVILWRPANSNTRDSRNSLFLFSRWETTWHYVDVLREFWKIFLGKRPALFKSGQWHFHQDNVPVHNSILCTDYLS